MMILRCWFLHIRRNPIYMGVVPLQEVAKRVCLFPRSQRWTWLEMQQWTRTFLMCTTRRLKGSKSLANLAKPLLEIAQNPSMMPWKRSTSAKIMNLKIKLFRSHNRSWRQNSLVALKWALKKLWKVRIPKSRLSILIKLNRLFKMLRRSLI